MDAFTLGITRRRRLVIAIFLICTVVCAVLFLGVGVNYDLTDYLPEDAESTVALDIICLLYTSSTCSPFKSMSTFTSSEGR